MSPVNKPKNNSPYAKLIRKSKEEKKKASWIKGGPNLYILTATAVGFVALYYYVKQKMKQQHVALLKNTIMDEENVLIGGNWELINQDGEKVSNKDYEGDWCLIYFGFTHCPDICPDEIEKIVEVMDILGKNPGLPKLKALFVTVDPERDSPESLKTYLAEFSDKIVGLTGNADELRKIWNAFKVYHSMGPKDEDGDYIVDHSIITYLMNPNGKYEGHFARSKTNIDVANAVEKKMNIWKPKS
ncbi:protein SCO1 homolog, mitochondrial-like [Ruditapes philippinarum]|uniref:protein SCO1 homolog, mitochondrial-like n=1 Tax=Ruditapes philippinarum TaxID=129788 RepID=UPI00295B7DB8|nr:protein SCO1 homolog, mitochondrial-like [Ruditapes philippinarum]